MYKLFKDNGERFNEPARFIGMYKGARLYESKSIYAGHIVRVERGRKVAFIYDPGRVWRYNCVKNYPFTKQP